MTRWRRPRRSFDVDAIRPLVLQTLEWFGIERCLFASNFPVDRLGVDYHTLWATFDYLTRDLSDSERRALFHDNAARLYRLRLFDRATGEPSSEGVTERRSGRGRHTRA